MTKSTGVRAQAKRERERLRAERPYKLINPLVKYGGHIGRTVDAFCRIDELLQSISLFLHELANDSSQVVTRKEQQDFFTFMQLAEAIPDFEAMVMGGSEDDLYRIAKLIREGMNKTRQPVDLTLRRNVKSNRGFKSDTTGRLLCPCDLDWSDSKTRACLRKRRHTLQESELPVFLWEGYRNDPEEFWKGLFRSEILVWAFKYVFTSPSSVKGKGKPTRASNSLIHGMTRVTPASIACVAAHVFFALSSAKEFMTTAAYPNYPSMVVSEEETLYKFLLDLLYDEESSTEVANLLTWWDQQIFPESCGERQAPAREKAARAKIEEKRLTLQTILVAVSQA